jgi:hypothetical protein
LLGLGRGAWRCRYDWDFLDNDIIFFLGSGRLVGALRRDDGLRVVDFKIPLLWIERGVGMSLELVRHRNYPAATTVPKKRSSYTREEGGH